MELSFPALFRTIKQRDQREPVYRAQLLFTGGVFAEDAVLQRATTKLIRKSKKWLNRLAESQRHQLLSSTLFHRDVSTKRFKLELDLRSRMARIKVFVVVMKAFDRRIAMIPALSDCWYEVGNKESLETRTREVLQKFFRDQYKEQREDAITPESIAVEGESWVSNIDVDVRVEQKSADDQAKKMLSLWSGEELNGAAELDRVGRCLDWLYPDDLESAIGRDETVEQIDRLLNLKEKRPLLLVGNSQTGKTAIIHEVVRRRVERRKNNNSTRRITWLLSPQRLISGMSYVGQWENRLLAIFHEARKREHILYFDDILGLFRAGQSRDSDLCVADLLSEALHRRDMRVLGEMTPDAFDKLTSLNIGFADQFHVIRIQPTTDEQTLRIAIKVMRNQEQKQRCRFADSSLPTVIQLQRQYVAHAAFPGKAAQFLKQLAVKFHNQPIYRESVLQEFRDTTGISLSLLDDRQTVTHHDAEQFLQSKIVGQQRAIDACANVVTTAKARLCPPGKPLATMLFLGPTGVGKTECAKALSEYMFSDSGKLLRFDLNEFKSSYSAARLVGTMNDPEGLLTSAVRQQPYCVILLDEIEKAHRDVFDILLQVTGEGRLTDALGRTTDFSNAVIIMTSNLGTRTSGNRAGFSEGNDEHHFIRAARQFFRPEFFNRIDRIVPFDSLTRSEIARIADQMMQQVISREGLVRRRCILQIDSSAIQRIVEDGYNPQLGARAMKRTIEQQFTQPVAAKLSSIRSDLPTIVRLSRSGDAFDVRVRSLENAEPIFRPTTTPPIDEVINATRSFLARIRNDHLSEKPAGDISSEGIAPELLHFYALDEQVNKITEQINQIEEKLDEERSVVRRPELPITGDRQPRVRNRRDVEYRASSRQLLKALNSVRDIRKLVDETVDKFAARQSKVDPAISSLLNECALVDTMLKPSDDECIFFIRGHGILGDLSSRDYGGASANALNARLAQSYAIMFGMQLGYEIRSYQFVLNGTDHISVMHLKGSCLSPIIARECASQLYCDASGRLHLIQAGEIEVDSVTGKSIRRLIDEDDASGEVEFDERKIEDIEMRETMDEKLNPQVLRMHDFKFRTIDFRTAHAFTDTLTGKLMFDLLAGGLELPKELGVLEDQ